MSGNRPIVGSQVTVALPGETAWARVVAHVRDSLHLIHAQFDQALHGTSGHGWKAGQIVTLRPTSHLLTPGMTWEPTEEQKPPEVRREPPGPYDGRVTS